MLQAAVIDAPGRPLLTTVSAAVPERNAVATNSIATLRSPQAAATAGGILGGLRGGGGGAVIGGIGGIGGGGGGGGSSAAVMGEPI